jgi:hypothetical protein
MDVARYDFGKAIDHSNKWFVPIIRRATDSPQQCPVRRSLDPFLYCVASHWTHPVKIK